MGWPLLARGRAKSHGSFAGISWADGPTASAIEQSGGKLTLAMRPAAENWRKYGRNRNDVQNLALSARIMPRRNNIARAAHMIYAA